MELNFVLDSVETNKQVLGLKQPKSAIRKFVPVPPLAQLYITIFYDPPLVTNWLWTAFSSKDLRKSIIMNC